MRLAILEVSHWHMPLYLEGIRRSEVEVVALSDRSSPKRERWQSEFGCRTYEDYNELLLKEQVDFAVVFGVHCEMPRIAAAVIEKSIPFVIEKPGGKRSQDVRMIRDLASQNELFNAVPLIYADSPILSAINDVDRSRSLVHYSLKNLAGSPERYVRQDVPWMLVPEQSGGGCLINFAPHFIDLALRLSASVPVSINAHIGNRLWGEEIEDHASIMMAFSDGGIAAIELGYTFLDSEECKREFALTYRSREAFHHTAPDGLISYKGASGAAEKIEHKLDLDTDGYYADFIAKTIRQYQTGETPAATLDDLVSAMEIVDACYLSATSGKTVSLGEARDRKST